MAFLRKAPQPEVFRVNLRLKRPEDLFVKPDVTPLSADYQDYSYTSGLEFIYGELYGARRARPVAATIALPPECLEPDLAGRLSQAVDRYCRGRVAEVSHEINALRARGQRGLLFGIVALVMLLAVSRPLLESQSAWLNIVGDGIVAGAWVAIWFPLDTLIFSLGHEELNRRIYQQLQTMTLTVEADASAPVSAGLGSR